MKFFTLRISEQKYSRDDLTDYEFIGEIITEESSKCFLCGKHLSVRLWLPPYRIKLTAWEQYFGDVIVYIGGIVVSDRFASLFKSSGLTGLTDFAEVEVKKLIRKKKKLKSIEPPKYFHVNIARSRAAIDLRQSGFEFGNENIDDICPECRLGRTMKRWKRVIFELGTWSGEDIFIARGLAGEIFVSERFKEFWDKHDFKNAVLIPTEEYGHDFYPWENEKEGDEEKLKEIEESYLKLQPSDNAIKEHLKSLSLMTGYKSRKLFIRILQERKPDFGASISLLLEPMIELVENIGAIIPGLFELIGTDYYKVDIYYFIAELLARRAINESDVSQHGEVIIRDFEQAYADCESNREDVDDAEKILEFTSDLMGCLKDGNRISPLLRKGLLHTEPRVQLYSAVSLIRIGETVQEEVLAKIAENPLLRLMMYEALEKIEKLEHFPVKGMKQYHFAESAMVRWLAFPTEFGRPPDKIELIGTKLIHKEQKEDSGWLYLYKYFYEDDENGWMVGISGIQPEDRTGFRLFGSMTFSHCNKLDAMSIEEHFASFINYDYKDFVDDKEQ